MSQRGKRGNNHRLECDPQPPPTKRRKGRPPNGSTAIGGAAGAIGSKATTSSSTNDNDHPEGGGTANNSGNSSALSMPPPLPMASAASTSHTISSKLPSSSTAGVGSGGGTSSSVPWQARSVADIKISSIYNRSSTEAPAELYRKDLISAMKLPDSEPLASNEYLIVTDQWKQEWEKGVQVPVNPDSLPEPSVFVMQQPIVEPAHDFKLPKNRYIRITKDDTFTTELHYLTNVVALAENTCAYDIDQVDEVWLNLLNKERAYSGATPITSEQFERVIEELEIRCWEQIQVILKNDEGLGIEYDENVICDVCRSPDSEEANEMVFCDNCNICVHQACYGITAIPSGQWLCRTCSMDIKPGCVLCPNKGGAMKSTKSGRNWAHVSCALWIPEVSIGCVDRMEPITKISSIPQSRWALVCVLCKERVGACIQCSVKTCKTAYHVTCAFQHGLEMRAIIEEGNAEDGVKLRSYCLKHSMGSKEKKGNQKCTNNGMCSGIDDDDCRRRKSRKDMTSEERNQVRALRLQEVEAEFDKHVNIRDISCHLFECDDDAIISIYNYWKLKRKSRNNHALIPPKSEDVELIARKQEQADMENHKLFVHLRQDLERVRNLCYMVSRREKLSRSQFKLREQIFYKQIAVLSEESLRNTEDTDESFTNAVIYANDGVALYDRFYTSSNYQGDNSLLSFENIKEKLLGVGRGGNRSQTSSVAASTSAAPSGSGAFSTTNRKKSISQYKKINVNGAKVPRRNGGGEHRANSSGTQSSSSSSTTSTGSSGSSSSSASSASSASSVSSASENESTKKKSSAKQRKKQSYSCSIEMRQKRRKTSATALASTAALAASSSSDEDEKNQELHKRKNNFLSQMQKELEKDKGALSSSNESEELIPPKNLDSTSKNVRHKPTSQIYSDSDSSTSTSEEDKDKAESNVSDYQTNIRTKAAMKEFTLQQSIQKQKKEAAAAKAKDDVTCAKDKNKAKKNETRVKEPVKENLQVEGFSKDKKDNRSKKNKNSDSTKPKSAEKQKVVTDLLVVPQRQAAKKASENMRTTNSYTCTATPTTVTTGGSKKDSRDDRDSERTQVCRDKDKDREKEKDKPKESCSRLDEKTRPKEKDKDKEREKPTTEKVVGKRGRPPKNPQKDESITISSKDIVSPRREKVQAKSDSAKTSSSKSTTESPNSIKPSTDMTKNNILVAYVPQRQAAKKAAEQLKSGGMVKPSAADAAPEEKDGKEGKLKSPESNKKHSSTSSDAHATKTRRLSKEVVAAKEAATKETVATSRTTATRRSKDSTTDVKELQNKVPAARPVLEPTPVAAALIPSLPEVFEPSSPAEKTKNKEGREGGSRRSSVQNVNLTSTSESSSSSSSSCSSSSSDDSEVDENRKSSTTRKLSKSSAGGEKSTKKATTAVLDEAPKSPIAKSISPIHTKLPSISHSNDNGSINGSKETPKKEEIPHTRMADSPTIPEEKKVSESVPPIVLDDDDEEEEQASKGKASPEKEKEEEIVAFQTIEIDDDDVTKAPPSPNLEEEITQRKADLVSSFSTYNNTSTNSNLSNTSKSLRNFGALDKLLNKKERELSSNNSSAMDERKSSSSAAESTSNMESDMYIEDMKESQEDEPAEGERIPTPSIQVKCNRSIRIEDPDIIDLDSSSAQSLKIDSNEQLQADEAADNSSEKPPQTPPMPSSSEESQKILEQSPATPAAHHRHHHRKSSFNPTSEDQMNLLDNIRDPEDNDNDDDDDDDDDATAALTEFSFSQVLDPPDADCADHEPPTGNDSHKEDDSALTMNLVKKLRQSQSQKRNHNKCDDVPTDFGPPPTPAIPTTFHHNHHAEDLFQQKENSAPTTQFKDDSLQDEKAVTDPPAVPQLTNNNSCSLVVPFSENAINFLDKSSTHSSIVQFPSLQSSAEQQSQHILQDSSALNDASSLFLSGTGVGDKKKTPQSLANNSECFNKLADFKQPDFVDLHSAKDTSMDFTTNIESVSSKLVDCDYDENTRMQSPYMNAPNMWNENDLIQTRRSVSTSPSSVSESNDLPQQLTPCSKSNQQPQQQDCNIVVNQKSHFGGALESFGDALSSQFNSITQQNNISQNMVNGIDMMSTPYGFSQQQTNHSQNQYNGPVSLFHAPPPHSNIPNHINQSSFPTPGAVLFPSAGLAGNVPLTASQSHTQSQQQNSSIFGNHRNHMQETAPSPFMTSMSTGNGGSGGAAFTSSTHNLALTAAIVSTPGATLDHHSPQNHQFNATSAQFNSLLELIPPTSNASNKESPLKRTSARFSQQQQQQPPPRKSPQMHKSPGKSPRQMELLSKQLAPKSGGGKFDGQTTGRQRKNSTRGTGTGRGRGRGRGRGGRLSSTSQMPPAFDYGNTHIVNNLVGTPYEFNYEEDMASSNVENLQSLRDRRRSSDCRGNLQQNTTPDEQKFSSPSYTCKMRSSTQTTASNNCNTRHGDLKTPTVNSVSILHSIVGTTLPGPVDMRTFGLDFEPQHSSASQEAYNNNLLGAFDSGIADQTLPDIDEEVEKELQSALKAIGTGIRHTQNSQPTNAPEVVMPAELQTSMETTSEEISIDSDTTNTKVSLSDSRNQLKLKIKGPLAYPDMYNSTNLSVQQSSAQVSVSQVTIIGGNSAVGGGGGGTSGIRRMRKKELLQWFQKETNVDDTVGLQLSAEKQASSSDSIMISRCVGIPKAVDSMLSIPTKDDYKGYNSTETTSKRKRFGSRELRQLDMSYDVTEGNPERRRSGCSTGSNLSVNNETGKTTGKRRGRSKTLESEEEQTPKLKIKIRKKSYESTSTTASGGSTGNSGVGASTNMRIVSCPPKKRLTPNYVIPTFEMLRRESMNYRKKVMADFGNDDEDKASASASASAGKLDVQPHTSKKKSSKQKKEHKKKKKQDKHIQVIENNASEATPKLIIRFGKRKIVEEEAVADDMATKSSDTAVPIVPIRLKLARNSDGGGYVIGNKQQPLSQQSVDQEKDHEQSEENPTESDRLLAETPEGKDTKTNQPVPPLKLRTNYHSEQNATDINAGYSNSSNSSSSTPPPPPSAPPLTSDTAKTADAPTDPLSSTVKSLSTSAAANDCSLLPLNKDCEVR